MGQNREEEREKEERSFRLKHKSPFSYRVEELILGGKKGTRRSEAGMNEGRRR